MQVRTWNFDIKKFINGNDGSNVLFVLFKLTIFFPVLIKLGIAFVENAAIAKRWWWHFNLHSRPPVSEDFEDFATKQEFELFISFQISSRASIHNGLEWIKLSIVGRFFGNSWFSFLPIFKTISFYRVSQSELTKVNWGWQIKICKLNFVWKWFWNPEIGGFLELQPVFMKCLHSALYWTRCKSPSFSIWFSTIFGLNMAIFSLDCRPIWLNTC